MKISLQELFEQKSKPVALNQEDFPVDVRKLIIESLNEADALELDLANVRSLSPSFAYEVFGKLVDIYGSDVESKIIFINDIANLKTRILDAIHRRSKVLSA